MQRPSTITFIVCWLVGVPLRIASIIEACIQVTYDHYVFFKTVSLNGSKLREHLHASIYSNKTISFFVKGKVESHFRDITSVHTSGVIPPHPTSGL